MQTKTSVSRALLISPFARLGICLAVLAAFLSFGARPLRAGSATWSQNPRDGDWNNTLNWMPRTIPNTPADTATFTTSTITDIFLADGAIEIDGILFAAGASAFTITPEALTLSGAGLTNNSGVTQNFRLEENYSGVVFFGSSLSFANNASAGDATYTAEGFFFISGSSNEVTFNDNSSAASAVFVNNAGYFPGRTLFFDQSTAANAAFTNNASPQSDGTIGGYIIFQDEASAGNAIITNNGGAATGGVTIFQNSATAAGATLIANRGDFGGTSGRIHFLDDSTGGTARIALNGNGLLFLSHKSPGLTVGSIEGDGFVSLGRSNLTVGSNNLNTIFSGGIQGSGSLTKIGTGKLSLTGNSTYTGGTIISQGTLLLNNRAGSATGTGLVQVEGGTMGGTGTVSGAVTVGAASTPARLSPGSGLNLGSITSQGSLTFGPRATCEIELNSSAIAADQLVANGVTIERRATITIADLGVFPVPSGTVYTIINNTATTLISGTFSNLGDGTTFIYGPNTYLVNYKGGDGNDLTLTVQ